MVVRGERVRPVRVDPRRVEVTMKWRRLALVAALCALSLVAFVPAASASTAYSFNLHVPNTAVNPGNGSALSRIVLGLCDRAGRC